jgi:hypothetical protein
MVPKPVEELRPYKPLFELKAKEETMSPVRYEEGNVDMTAAKRRMGKNYHQCLMKRVQAGDDPLRLSIEKYEYLLGGGQGISLYGEGCPLCERYIPTSCKGCPVHKFTGKADCKDTPWKEIHEVCSEMKVSMRSSYDPTILSDAGMAKLMPVLKKEWEFLKALEDGDTMKAKMLCNIPLEKPKKLHKVTTYNVRMVGSYTVTFDSDDDEDGSGSEEEAIDIAMSNYGNDDLMFEIEDIEVEEEMVDDDDA